VGGPLSIEPVTLTTDPRFFQGVLVDYYALLCHAVLLPEICIIDVLLVYNCYDTMAL
jgi:hypothetical protein